MGFGPPPPPPGMQPQKTPQEQAMEEINKPLDLSPPAPPELMPKPDMTNFFGPAPLPVVGSAHGAQPPPGLGQPPALPFGGYRARGGPVMPGRAYMVGERGPEMIVPQQPGMVVPNGATPSPMNHRYGGGIAARGPVPVGRGINEPARQNERLNRIARQQFGMTGDPRMMLQMNWRNQMGGPPPEMVPQASVNGQPAEVLPPAGHFEPGISAGSQVWVRDAPTAPQPGPLGEIRPSEAPPELMPPQGGQGTQEMPPMPMGMPGTFSAPMPPWLQPMTSPKIGGFGATGLLPDPNRGAFDPTSALPPSALAHYTPPPPRFQALPAGGMEIIVDNNTGKQVGAYKPEGPPRPEPQLTAEQLGHIRAQGFEPDVVNGKAFDANGVPYLRRATQPTERVTVNAAGEESRSYQRPLAAPAAAPAAAQPTDRINSLRSKAGLPPIKTAATQATGQMPNTAHLSPLPPEQLLAEASAHYAKTGDASQLEEYFKQYPSERTRTAVATDTSQQGKRVMTQAEALRSRPQPAPEPGRPNTSLGQLANWMWPGMPAPIPGPRPKVPSLIHDGADAGILDDLRRLAAHGKNNPLLTIQR